MTTCIKCGRPIEDGELFCGTCAMNTPPAEPHKAARSGGKSKKIAVRKPAAHKQGLYTRTAKNHTAKPASNRKGVVALAVLLAVCLSLLIWQLATRRAQTVKLRLWQDELETRQTELDHLTHQQEADSQRIGELETQLQETTEALDRTRTELSSAQRSATQSEYDMTTQQAALEKANERLDELETENDDLTRQNTALEEENDALSEKSDFMDRYVVFVENDGSNLYHKYDCSHFPAKSFWAYSKRLAERNGYKACPHCSR